MADLVEDEGLREYRNGVEAVAEYMIVRGWPCERAAQALRAVIPYVDDPLQIGVITPEAIIHHICQSICERLAEIRKSE